MIGKKLPKCTTMICISCPMMVSLYFIRTLLKEVLPRYCIENKIPYQESLRLHTLSLQSCAQTMGYFSLWVSRFLTLLTQHTPPPSSTTGLQTASIHVTYWLICEEEHLTSLDKFKGQSTKTDLSLLSQCH